MLRNIKEKIKSKVPNPECKNTEEISLIIEDCLTSKAEFENNVTVYLKNNINQEGKDNNLEEDSFLILAKF